MKRLLLAVCLAGCNGTSTTDLATTESALTEAQCNFGAAGECRTAFEACIAAENADQVACRDALHACLPPPPPRPDLEGGCHGGDGGGQRPPPPPGGGLFGDGQRPPRGDRPPPNPECRAALDACLAAAPEDPRTCFEAEHQCVRDAIQQNFQVRCDLAAAECEGVTSDLCTTVLARCAEGIAHRPAACGGTEAEATPVTE
jgi:hypothetical protein